MSGYSAASLYRNILAQKQFHDITDKFMRSKLPFIPIKGIVLLDLLYTNIGERYLSDIDILVKAGDLQKIHSLMHELGYIPSKDSPSEWIPAGDGLPIDMHADIWYASSSELQRLWQMSPIRMIAGLPCQVMPKEEMIIHAVAHAFIHHGNREGDWEKDVVSMLSRWQESLDLKKLIFSAGAYNLITPFRAAFHQMQPKLPPAVGDAIAVLLKGKEKIFESWFLHKSLSLKHNLKGHILRFVFQRNVLFKMGFLLKMVFPSPYFIRRRYNRFSTIGVIGAYIMRPFTCMVYGFRVVKKMAGF
ncbi:MAG: nucleotidyltransferase family protein [bacterium]